MRRLSALALSVAVLGSLLSCSSGKIAQCRAFVETLNKAAPELEAAQAGLVPEESKAAWENLRKMAEVHGRIVAEVSAMEITDEGLKPRIEAWRAATRTLQQHASAVASAADGGRSDQAMALLDDLRGAVVEHDRRLKEIDAYCNGR